MRAPKPRRRSRSAVAVVELAFVMPLVVSLLLGILEVGRLVQVMQVLYNAAREGARQASTSTATLTDIKANVKTYIQNAQPNISDLTGYDLQYTNVTSPGVTDPTNATQLDRFSITVVLPYDNVRRTLVGYFVASGTQLRAQVDWYSLRDLPVEVTTTLPVD